MFTRCIHCCQDLGANQAVEHFQVGDKLAFDSEKGRLWVICPHCARWNLTPLEERWEAVEECERLFGMQRLRAQTTNIGYAKLRDGTGLVRIGRPLRPEFAAWRYGREFSRRHTRSMIIIGAAGFAGAGIAFGSAYIGAGVLLPHLAFAGYHMFRSLLGTPGEFELPRGPGRAWTVSSRETMVLPDQASGWKVSIRHHFGRVEHSGAEARRILSGVLARVNRSGGEDTLVQSAVKEVEERPADSLLLHIAKESEPLWNVDAPALAEFYRRDVIDEREHPINRAGLAHLSPVSRLALEMALHEGTEQRALDGELAELHAAWQEAEEIAGIADNLLLPPGADDFIERNRKPAG